MFDDSVVCFTQFSLNIKIVRFIDLISVFGALSLSSHLQFRRLLPMNREYKKLCHCRVCYTFHIPSA